MTTAADSLPDFTGCIVDQRYELVQMLGSGTYGVVYKALDTHSPASDPLYRAIKIICKAGRQPSELATIRREVALHSAVSGHPNIVGLHEAYDDDDFYYIILEYYPGGDLFEQICDNRVYVQNDELLRSALLSLIDAVQACHEERIAHRDLKPENILTSADGAQTYLADFGLASDKRMIDEFGSGTAIYMAPECMGPVPYCARAADVWALGVILVNMVSCTNPWQKPSLRDPCFSNFLNDPDYFYETLPISEGVHSILRRIFTINPLRRVTLPKLRQMVLALDKFFRSPEDDVDSEIPQPLRVINRTEEDEEDEDEEDEKQEQDADTKPCHYAFEESPPSSPLIKQKQSTPEIETEVEPEPYRPTLDMAKVIALCDMDYTNPRSCSRSSSLDISLPSLSSSSSSISSASDDDWEGKDDTGVVDAWSATSSKDVEEIDWRKGSTARMLMAHYLTQSRLRGE